MLDRTGHELLPPIEKTYKLRSGYFFSFPTDDECHIKQHVWGESEVKIADPEKKGWVRLFFSKIDGKTPVQQMLELVPEHREQQMLKLLASLEKRYLLGAEDQAELQQHAESWWQHLLGQRKPDQRVVLDTLKEARLLILGAGVVGSRVAFNLSQLGIGHITVMDSRHISTEDRWVHHCYAQARIGEPRAQELAGILNAWQDKGQVTGLACSELERELYLQEHLAQYDIILVCEDVYDHSLIEAVNQLALLRQKRWSLLFIDGWHVYIGPTFIPSQTGCSSCFLMSREDYHSIQLTARSKESFLHIRPSPLLADTAVGLFTLDIPNLLGKMPRRIENEASLTLGRQLHFDMRTYDASFVRVLKKPTCEVCGQVKNLEAI